MPVQAVLDRNDMEQTIGVVQTDLAHLVHRGMAGDQEALPAIRELLDQAPELWTQARTLSTQVEHAWLQTLTGEDLVTREILTRQVDLLKAALAGPDVSPLEQLLIDRICACFLALQHAELRTASRLQHGRTPSNAEEKRLDSLQKRFLGAVKSLAQIRRLMTPTLQLNVAQQQINLASPVADLRLDNASKRPAEDARIPTHAPR